MGSHVFDIPQGALDGLHVAYAYFIIFFSSAISTRYNDILIFEAVK